MEDPHGEYVWQVRSYECGPEGTATLPTVCNYLQEAASLHAKALGFSKSDFTEENITWVLTRLRVEMARYPAWEEPVRVLTYPRGVRRVVAGRDFVLTSERTGERLGAAASEWMTIDLARRRMVPIPRVVSENINAARPPVFGEPAFTPKLRLPADAVPEGAARRFPAMRACIDLNGHVNNVHYLTWMLESAPADAGVCVAAEVVFRSETFAGEDVTAETARDAADPAVRWHRVASPAGADHILARTRWVSALSPART